MRVLHALSTIIRATFLLGLLAGGFLVAAFASLYGARPRLETPAEAAIVFTGAPERIEAGLDLVARGAAKQLFISGANPHAGVWIAKFPQQFGLHRADLENLMSCCVTFGVLAQDTIQNGREATCWLMRRNPRGPVLLVTSAAHMPRAMAALTQQASGVVVHPHSVPDRGTEQQKRRRLVTEVVKYAATLAALRLPHAATWYGPFEGGCPAQE